MQAARLNFKLQLWIVTIGIILLGLKLSAWYVTNSVAILTDALESIVNVVSGFLGLYSLYLSALPKDKNHPYGHGKVEFISAAVEGSLILFAGAVICIEAVQKMAYPSEVQGISTGIILTGISAIINFALGWMAESKGKKNQSPALRSSGKHLKTDAYSSIGIIIGLCALQLTGLSWIDSLVALIFAAIIMVTGVRVIRNSVAGIMDEADSDLLKDVVHVLEKNRIPAWIDLHNLRIIKYGATLHIDCHVTLPWYLNIHKAHDEVEKIETLIRDNFGNQVEFFIHIDGCLDFSCRLCSVDGCTQRQLPFEKTIHWTVENISTNTKHSLPS